MGCKRHDRERRRLSGALWRMAAVVWLGLVACGFAVAQAPAHEGTPPTLRLPPDARPTHYALTMTIVPGEAKAPGEISIDVALDRPHSTVWLNAVALTVSRVLVDGIEAHPRIDDRTDQFVGLAFDPPLSAGPHRLTLAFEAQQNANSARGLFTVEDGGAHYTLTQFEATAARRAFPCFDDPALKTPWQVTLRVPRDVTAVANAPVVAEKDIGDGMKEVRFAETKPLPSYLVAFAVGPFDIVDAGDVGPARTSLRIIVARGHARDAEFAAHALPQLLQEEERWFGIEYPFAKLDHLAIPLSVRFAMENAGLITYGAPILLAPRAATAPFRHGLANVAAHEMAHQWFGDLVTMAWWDDIWLNEAFANWFANKMVDAWQSGYEHGAAHVRERADAIETDSLPSARRIRQPIETRGDIVNAFDSITYRKGATVIGMFEGWLGEDAFRRGVLGYLTAHRYASATADDFLGALSAASAKPVAPAFATFLEQNGVPQMRVDLDCSAKPAQLGLAQHRHVPAGVPPGPQHWDIPVCVRYGSADATRESCTLMTAPAAKLELEGACPTFVFANAGARGYYIPDYSPSLLADLRSQRRALTTPELASVVYDMRPLLRAGAVDVAHALDWVRIGAAADERSVVAAALEVARFIRNDTIAPKTRPRFDRFVQHVFGPRARVLGFVGKRGETDDDALLRRELLRLAAAGDPVLARKARALAMAWIIDRQAVDPAVADTALFVAAQNGDARLFDAMMDALRTSTDGLDRRNLMVALMSFRDPPLVRRALGMLLDPTLDVRDVTTALGIATGSAPPSREPYDFIVAHFDALAGRVDRDAPATWPYYAAALCSSGDRAAVEAFWRPRVDRYAGAERNLAKTLEAIDACTRLREREAANVDAYLARSLRSVNASRAASRPSSN